MVTIDREKAKSLNVPFSQITSALQIYMGSQYVNDFNKFGRTYQVIAQADAPYRSSAENIAQLKVRNVRGEMVPLGAFATWQAERAIGDHDRNTLRLRLDPQGDPAELEPGMTVSLSR